MNYIGALQCAHSGNRVRRKVWNDESWAVLKGNSLVVSAGGKPPDRTIREADKEALDWEIMP
jgi:hypothetical protein